MLKSTDDQPGSEDRGQDHREGANATRFQALALPHLDMVYRVACGLTGNEVEAEDLVQETFIRALRAFERFELRECGPRPWLMRILRNAFYSERKRHRRRPVLLDDLGVDIDCFVDEGDGDVANPGTLETINWDEFDEDLKSAVDQLRVEYRIVLLLWSVEGLSYKEIAAACDWPLGTVMSRLYRARQELGKLLRDYARERKLSTERFD